MKETRSCPHCGGEILAIAKKCKHCKKFLETVENLAPAEGDPPHPEDAEQEGDRGFSRIIGKIYRKGRMDVGYHPWKPIGLFALTNAAIFVSVSVITLGRVWIAMLALLIGMTVPFIMLLLSKYLAKESHDIQMIDPDNFADEYERRLYFLVKTLSERAGLPVVPELGIYDSAEINAFATGHSRESSMIAFSSALVDYMDDDALAAIAAHEVAHIANGDMLSMTLMMSVVNTVILLINMAMIWILDDHDDGILERIVKKLIRFAVVAVLLFLGNLLMLWFSRHREFKADRLAAELVWPEAMIKALGGLKEEVEFDQLESQEAYASFKISSPPAICDLFSTHPSLDRRIKRLQNMQ